MNQTTHLTAITIQLINADEPEENQWNTFYTNFTNNLISYFSHNFNTNILLQTNHLPYSLQTLISVRCSTMFLYTPSYSGYISQKSEINQYNRSPTQVTWKEWWSRLARLGVCYTNTPALYHCEGHSICIYQCRWLCKLLHLL